ncbi:MAG TPA: hypothetical protein EYO37_00730 [Nitrospina sp.]|nr:hypothetical protein [Nitrospina sp.]
MRYLISTSSISRYGQYLKSLEYYSKGHHFVLFFIPWLKYALTVGCLQYSDFSLAVEGGVFNRGP